MLKKILIILLIVIALIIILPILYILFLLKETFLANYDWYIKYKIEYTNEVKKEDKEKIEEILVKSDSVKKTIEYSNKVKITNLGYGKCSNVESNILQVQYYHPFAGNNLTKYALNSKNQYVRCYFSGTIEPRNIKVE